MEMSWEKTFSMILQIFQFPKTTLNFTLFRNVLFPLNEKYSGLPDLKKIKPKKVANDQKINLAP